MTTMTTTKMQFEVLAGKHHDEAPARGVLGRVYRKGEIVESNDDLEKKFKNHFRRVYPGQSGSNVTDPAVIKQIKDAARAEVLAELGAKYPELAKAFGGAPAPEAPAKPGKTSAATTARGTEVTKDFPEILAMPEGFKIFQRGEVFHVFVGDSLKPIHPAGLKREDVAGAVKKYLD